MRHSILFGSIGVLAETSEIQREAFNHAFAEAGLNWFWGADHYAELLQRSGGEARIRAYAEEKGETVDAEHLHRRKSELFQARLRDGVDLRPGVADVIATAHEAGVPIALCTTTSEDNVLRLLKATGLAIADFDFVGHRGLVTNGKPDPEIYGKALTALGCSADDAIAVEDSGVSMQAPLAAGIPSVAFPGRYHRNDDFGAASQITDHLSPAILGLPTRQSA